MTSVVDRFLKYVSFDTQSDETSETCPSTMKQKDLGAALVEEMLQMGITDARMDENGYVYGTVPGDPSLPTIGLIAHMDTAPDAPGNDIKAKIVEYQGGDILLNEAQNFVMKVCDYPNLKNHTGKHLIVTDGTTLLGGDDKAGIAEILTAAEFLIQHPEIVHGPIRIGFTPDEEVGQGVKFFDVAKFGADFAYTIDGGEIGELEYENFNAASAVIDITGLSIHPGSAKNKMINAINVGIELHNMLPVFERPEYTENREGFSHLIGFDGGVEHTRMQYIIRDHSAELYEKKKNLIKSACDYMNVKYGEGTVKLTLSDSYRNMQEMIEPHMFLVDYVSEVYEELGIEGHIIPCRGGTDGARLSFMGLPCPNLGTGCHNCHGHFEYAVVESMEKMVDVIVKLAQKFVK